MQEPVKQTSKRILVVTKRFRYKFGGTPEAVLLLSRAFFGIGIATDVFAQALLLRDAGQLRDLPEVDDGENDVSIFSRLGTYEFLFVTGAWNIAALPLVIVARLKGLRILYAPKGQLCAIEFSRLRDLKKVVYLLLVEFWIAMLAHRVSFTSELEQHATLLPNFLKRAKGFVQPEVSDLTRLPVSAVASRRTEGKLTLGFIAQISPRKGLLELVEGFLGWCEENRESETSLVVAGVPLDGCEAYFDDIKARISSHDYGHQVRFLGQVFGEERNRFYTSIDALVVPSKFESYGLTVLEARWFGVPVLVGPRLGVLEFLEYLDGVQIFDDVSRSSIMRGIQKLMETFSSVKEQASQHIHLIADELDGRRVVRSMLTELDADYAETEAHTDTVRK